MIVRTSLNNAHSRNVVVFADDTDILVLLLSHWSASEHNTIYFCTVDRKVRKYWNIGQLSCGFMDRNLLFAHAWSGSDTTSAIFNKGKLKILQLLKVPRMKQLIQKFGQPTATQDDIGYAGCQIFIEM